MHFIRFFGMFLAMFLTFVAAREFDSKRGSIMYFPRVGRMDPAMAKDKFDLEQIRAANWDEASENFERLPEDGKPFYWFGNRPVKMHKRNPSEDETLPWARIIINGIPFPAKVYYNSISEEVPSNLVQKQKDVLQ